MDTKYQLITIGAQQPLKTEIVQTFVMRVEELGLSKDALSIIDALNFDIDYKPNAPSVALYFGENGATNFSDIHLLKKLQRDAVFIVPVVVNLKNFSSSTPAELRGINGFALTSHTEVDALVNRILEGLSLLRQSRRLFISYRRVESRTAAIQLYEQFDASGFDVFLDTHSIKPGEPVQDELWHRLVDTDVVVLLNTPGFFESRWTSEELAKASAMSIGVVQLIYPGHTPDDYASLCFPIYLEQSHFVSHDYKNPNALFTQDALKLIAGQVEAVRARSLAARQDGIIQEFTAAATKLSVDAHLQPEKIITLKNKSGANVAIIPTVGVPQALTYNQTEELIKRIHQDETMETFLLYDHRNIREKWLNHLVWLDLYLPIKAVKITEVENWLNQNTML